MHVINRLTDCLMFFCYSGRTRRFAPLHFLFSDQERGCDPIRSLDQIDVAGDDVSPSPNARGGN